MSVLIVDGVPIGEAEKLKVVVPVHAEAIIWLTVIGNLQLALRHPGNTGFSSIQIRKFAEAVLGKLRAEALITEELAQAAFADFYIAHGGGL